MESLHSLPPSEETEIRDDMSTRTIPRSEASHQSSQAMSSAVAGYTNEIERQRHSRKLTTTTRTQTDSSIGNC